jgi:5-methylthioadenosine/S-adenosylhomocysteine deaminase
MDELDLAVVDTLLVTMRGDGLGIVEDGAVGVRDGDVAYVGPTAELDADAEVVVDGDGCLTMPGVVDAHAHMRHTVVRGGAQDVPEIEWMNDALGPLATNVTPEDEVAGARLGVLEAVRSGATTVCEYTGHVERLVEEVYRPLGVRVVATETINEVPDDRSGADPDEPYPFERAKGEAALDRAEALFETYDDAPLVHPAYGPHALDMMSLELLHEIVDRAEERDRGVHMHVAQGAREQRQIEARYGDDATTVSVLEEEGLLSPQLTGAHLHGATVEERRTLAEAGVKMTGNPSSIAGIDGITPPIVEYREHGGVVGIGTDQAPGNGGHNVLRELRTASMLSKTQRTDPTALPAWEALRVATVDGARSLGIGDRVGSLEPGKAGDVVVVDLDTVSLAPTVSEPFHTAIPNLVYASNGSEVRDVFVGGDAVLRDGEFVDVDVDAVVEDVNERAERAFAEGADDWRAAGSELVDAVDEGRL